MAKAIGWYVHYTATGYNTLGIAPPKGKPKTGWNSQRTAILNRAKYVSNQAKLSQQDITNLKTLFETGWTELGKDPHIQEKIQTALLTDFGITVQDIIGNINMSTGLALTVNPKTYGVAQYKGGAAAQDAQGQYELTKYINILYNDINNAQSVIAQAIKREGLNAKEFQKKLQNIYTDFQKSIAIYNTVISSSGGKINPQIMKILSDQYKQASVKSLSQIKSDLNDLIKLVGIPPVALIQGQTFELMAQYLPELVNNSANQVLKNALGNSSPQKVGGNREVIMYDVGSFQQSGLQKIGNSTIKTTASQTGSSQGKVDIILNWNNNPIKMSLKNYNLSSAHWITLTSGSPLAFLIQDLDKDFINHFINIFSKHYKDQNSDQLADIKNKQAKRNKIKSEIMLALLYKAASGDNFGRSPASVFVMNDASSGKVTVLTMEQLLIKMSKVLNNSGAVSITGNGEPINKWQFENEWKNSSNERIRSLLQELHALKITVKIKPGVIK